MTPSKRNNASNAGLAASSGHMTWRAVGASSLLSRAWMKNRHKWMIWKVCRASTCICLWGCVLFYSGDCICNFRHSRDRNEFDSLRTDHRGTAQPLRRSFSAFNTFLAIKSVEGKGNVSFSTPLSRTLPTPLVLLFKSGDVVCNPHLTASLYLCFHVT